MLASTSSDFGPFLFSIVAILLAAKIGGELAERVKVPSVLGEILAGIAIGPSALGLVDLHDVLTSNAVTVLAELGVLLLLLQVGMEMDLAELGKVGKSSLIVAVIGVAAPMAGGTAAAMALGQDGKTAIFVGAALTATSVGITARVFGDLKALSMTESRIVLGAAVADDVLGLVILTVVVKIVTEGTVGIGTIAGTFGLALAFLVVSGVVGLTMAPRLFDFVHRVSRSSAAVPVLAFVVLFVFAGFANMAKLAPIIGAFMAGLALAKTRHHERIHHETNSIGNLLMPIFFVQIGLNTDIGVMGDPKVIGVAAILLVIAVVGKLAAAAGAMGIRADRLLIGLGMVPRGEVGLIFASIGLANGVLDDELYASLLIVMLVTTLITPPALRWRLSNTSERRLADDLVGAGDPEPADGWLHVADGTIRLTGRPAATLTVPLVLEAGALAGEARPDDSLLEWVGANRTAPLEWRTDDTPRLVEIAGAAEPRALRFLEVSGVLERALPEISAWLERRRHDTSELDPSRILRFPTVERITAIIAGSDALAGKALDDSVRLELLQLAALVHDVSPTDRAVAHQLALRLTTDDDVAEILRLLDDAELLNAAAGDPDTFDRQRLLHLAHHLGTDARIRSAYVSVVAQGQLNEWRRQALDELYGQLLELQRIGARRDGGEGALVERRKRQAKALADSDATRDRIDAASDAYLLSHDPDEVARHARLVEPLPRRGAVRVAVTPHGEPNHWQVDIAFRDDKNSLARFTSSITDHGLDIIAAGVATWPDGGALDTFVVRGAHRPSARELAEEFEQRAKTPLAPPTLADATVEFDNTALPWHTACTLTCADEPGVLQGFAQILADHGVLVAEARISGSDRHVNDRFSLTDRHGQKLDAATIRRIEAAVAEPGRRRRRVVGV